MLYCESFPIAMIYCEKRSNKKATVRFTSFGKNIYLGVSKKHYSGLICASGVRGNPSEKVVMQLTRLWSQGSTEISAIEVDFLQYVIKDLEENYIVGCLFLLLLLSLTAYYSAGGKSEKFR